MVKSVKVSNMRSMRSGKEVANQFIIETEEGRYFQSYQSIIAFIPKGNTGDEAVDHKTVLDKNRWDWSVTTGKYRNEFLGEGKADTEKKIKAGIYLLVDLNT